MNAYHSLLQRQLRRHLGGAGELPVAWRSFLEDVNLAYCAADADRGMLERSLDLSSQELLQANSEMRAVFQALPDIFYRIDREGSILAVKAGAALDFLCHPRRPGEKLQSIPVPAASEVLTKALRRAVAEKGPTSVEYSLPAQGKDAFFEARFVPLLEQQLIVIVRNISAEKRLEERLRQSQKMDAIGQLAGGVAHDFNNLITVIRGNVSMVLSSELSGDAAEDALEEAMRAAERAGNLTRQLLLFSRQQALRPRALDLNGVVAGVTKMLQRIIGEHIKLESRFAPGCLPVRADAGMLEQMLLNLAVNSRDAMPKGGSLVLQTEAVDLGAEDLSGGGGNRRPGSFVRLSVTDTGCGIAPEHLPRIFEPFFSTKAVGKGTGLGLATVFGIVEQHEGWLEVESTVDVGTSFQVYFPRLAAELVDGAAATEAPDVRGGSESILIVEDEQSVRVLMSRWLERKGYRVATAVSGPDALRLWREYGGAFDLLVSDMVMPDGMTGGELAERLRSEKPELRIIQCSGYTTEMQTGGLPREDGVVFLEKPFDRLFFLLKVRASLDRR